MPIYEVQVKHEICGEIKVEADSPEEAAAKAKHLASDPAHIESPTVEWYSLIVCDENGDDTGWDGP